MRTLFFFLSLLFIVKVFAQNIEPFTLKGSINGIESGRLLLIAQTGENQFDTISSSAFKESQFDLTGTIEEPLLARLMVEGYEGGFVFIPEPGAKYEAFLANDSRFYIKGGKLQDTYALFLHECEQRVIALNKLVEQYKELLSARKYRTAARLNDSINVLRKEHDAYQCAFLEEHKNDLLGAILQESLMARSSDLQALENAYKYLGEESRKTTSGRLLLQKIERIRATKSGEPAPDFTLNDLNGKSICLQDIKAKILIVDFWASWCGPCRLSNPNLRKLYEEFHSKGLEIIGISLDEQKHSWIKAVEKDQLPWIHLSSLKGWKCEVARAYNVTGVPALFVLDSQKRIIATHLRGEQLHQFIQQKLVQ